jgi:phosphatidylglycerophosphatase A
VAGLARLIASGFGAGRAPVAPGTIGSLLAAAVGTGLLAVSPLALAAATVLATLIGLWAIRGARAGDDPGWVVIDEVAGQWLSMLPLARPSFSGVLLAVVLFRILDVTKPGPIGWVDRATGPLAVMGDDLLAGGVAAALLWTIRRATGGMLDW